jgi:hypothetical protein
VRARRDQVRRRSNESTLGAPGKTVSHKSNRETVTLIERRQAATPAGLGSAPIYVFPEAHVLEVEDSHHDGDRNIGPDNTRLIGLPKETARTCAGDRKRLQVAAADRRQSALNDRRGIDGLRKRLISCKRPRRAQKYQQPSNAAFEPDPDHVVSPWRLCSKPVLERLIAWAEQHRIDLTVGKCPTSAKNRATMDSCAFKRLRYERQWIGTDYVGIRNDHFVVCPGQRADDRSRSLSGRITQSAGVFEMMMRHLGAPDSANPNSIVRLDA